MIRVRLEAPTQEELAVTVARYLHDFHPAGYGTRVVEEGTTEEGGAYAILHRGSTCD